MKIIFIVIPILMIFLIFSCSSPQNIPVSNTQTAVLTAEIPLLNRESKIPQTAVKITPETDLAPPKSLSPEYEQPVPVAEINTAGAEDSPFIDENDLYFFFTPDVKVPVEKQIIDGVTGIYISHRVNGQWSKPERIILQNKGKISGEGCEYVHNNQMWFCSVREGYTGVHWFTAEYQNGKWQNWQNADFDSEYKVGELHFSNDGSEIYFHSDRAGGKGGLDIWISKKVNGQWSEPENVEAVNTAGSEGWPALSPDEQELWLSKDYGLWRSKKVEEKWTAPEKIISPLAGEASIDSSGNVYFVHHFFKDDQMLEADIYVARRK